MNRLQKEELVEEILEFKELVDTVGLEIDGMTKGFIMMTFVQEAISEIKNKAARESFGEVVKAVPLTPPHCPYMKDLSLDKKTGHWQAKCLITDQECNITDYGLGNYRDCLPYKAYEISKLANRPE